MAATSISDIYDAIYTQVAATLSDHTLLTNAIDIELNEHIFLEKGYGIHFSGSSRNIKNVTNFVYQLQELTITNTLQVFGADIDTTIRKTQEKQLLTNRDALIKALETNSSLDGKVAKLFFQSDGGIENVYGTDKKDFIMIRSIFTFEYYQNF